VKKLHFARYSNSGSTKGFSADLSYFCSYTLYSLDLIFNFSFLSFVFPHIFFFKIDTKKMAKFSLEKQTYEVPGSRSPGQTGINALPCFMLYKKKKN
jgi:hypothetical protein